MNMLDTEMRTAADGGQLYCKQIDDPFYRGKRRQDRGSLKATVRSIEKKCHVNRRDPIHKQMERALCVMAGTPNLLSVGGAAAGQKTMQYATTMKSLEVNHYEEPGSEPL